MSKGLLYYHVQKREVHARCTCMDLFLTSISTNYSQVYFKRYSESVPLSQPTCIFYLILKHCATCAACDGSFLALLSVNSSHRFWFVNAHRTGKIILLKTMHMYISLDNLKYLFFKLTESSEQLRRKTATPKIYFLGAKII